MPTWNLQSRPGHQRKAPRSSRMAKRNKRLRDAPCGVRCDGSALGFSPEASRTLTPDLLGSPQIASSHARDPKRSGACASQIEVLFPAAPLDCAEPLCDPLLTVLPRLALDNTESRAPVSPQHI